MTNGSGDSLELVWGCKEIGDAIGRTERQAYDMCVSGHLPAKQVGRRWVISRKKLIEYFTGEAA